MARQGKKQFLIQFEKDDSRDLYEGYEEVEEHPDVDHFNVAGIGQVAGHTDEPLHRHYTDVDHLA